MATTTGKLIRGLILGSFAWTSCYAEDEDGYLGILNANESLIESVSNKSGTSTGEFSTDSLLSSVREDAQWQTEGPVVVSVSGEVLGQLSTFEGSTNSLFNETIYVQVPYEDRCEACIGSMNSRFSTEGPKIYDSQSEKLKALIEKDLFNP